MVERGRALADGDFQRREVARGAFDDLAEALLLLTEALEQDRHMLLHLALGALHLLRCFVAAGDEELGELRPALGEFLVDARARGGKIARDLLTDAAQGLADPVAVVGKRLALARKLADQAADAKLVVAVGALERRHLVMHQGLELAGAADGAGNRVVHGGDLAADGLSQGGDGLLGELVRLGEAHRDLGHGRSHQPQFLGAPDEQRQEPENGDRHENGDEGGERGRIGEQPRGAVGRGKLIGDEAVGKDAADDEPDERGDERDEEGRLGRLLLQGEDQAADRRQVVVGGSGGNPARRRACGTARAGCGSCCCGTGCIAGIGWLLLFHLGFRCLALLLGPEPLGKRQLLLSLCARSRIERKGGIFSYVARGCPLDVERIIACAPCCHSGRRRFRFLRHHASLAQTNLEKTCAVHSNFVASGAGVVAGSACFRLEFTPKLAPRRIFPRFSIVNEFLGLKKA